MFGAEGSCSWSRICALLPLVGTIGRWLVVGVIGISDSLLRNFLFDLDHVLVIILSFYNTARALPASRVWTNLVLYKHFVTNC